VSVPAYPAYKDSGVAWLGEVPAHWRISRVRELVKLINGYPFDAGQFTVADGLPLVRIRDLNASKAVVRFGGEPVEAALITGADVLVGMDGDFNVGRWLGDGPALLNQRVCCLRGDPCILRMLEHALPIPLQRINDLTYSTTVKHLSSVQVLDIRVAFPPNAADLEALVRFLDRETGKIDALVEEQRRLIALLKEKRQAVISHAVTKGLNPHAPLKPSGIEWLGDIPAHWEVKRLKRVVPSITVGIVVEPSKLYAENGVPALRSLNVRPGRIEKDNLVCISTEGHEMHRKSRLAAGDVVAVRTGQPGTAAVVPPEMDGCNCIDLIVIRKPSHGCEQFLCWFLASDTAVRQFTEGSGGAIQQHFNIGTAADLVVTLPPMTEQRDIAEQLDRATGALDALVAEADRAITLLQERRAALISAAVTGKIDVRGLVGSAKAKEAA
jgi:type I restriction enzyme, S subunit